MFLICLFDHHTDPEFHLFKNREKAVAKAEELSNQYDWREEDQQDDIGEWLFLRELNGEGYHIYVQEIDIED